MYARRALELLAIDFVITRFILLFSIIEHMAAYQRLSTQQGPWHHRLLNQWMYCCKSRTDSYCPNMCMDS